MHTPSPVDAETAFHGSRRIDLALRGDRRRTVTLRLILQSEIEVFLDLTLRDEAEALRFCLAPEDRDLDLDTLTDEAREALTEENLELNFTRALAVVEARTARAQKTGAGVRGLIQMTASLLRPFAGASPPEATAERSS